MGTASEARLASVTGASSGIGLELARQFAQHGFDLVIAAEDGAITTVGQELASRYSRSVDAVQVDLRSYEAVEDLYRRIQATGRPLEAIAINAGVGVGGDFTRETDLQKELALIELNVASTVHLAKRVLPDMVGRRAGRVLFTASIAGIMPTPLEAVYGASKAFVLEFAASLRSELEGTGVTVTALLPGPTDTNFFQRAGLGDKKVAEKARANDPADVARMGFEALMAGKERVVAGNLEVKLQGAAARFVPESIKASMHKKMAETPRSK
ncbi:MAG TPA: SDR family NAD(P)-dependent oxidoreductase [Polyangiaceae bacterium]|jgi:short-subunit dehydrogenase|nr:SDR family NAD(P)-dependent oxidoreductase [Polyangiaceae bacterium]